MQANKAKADLMSWEKPPTLSAMIEAPRASELTYDEVVELLGKLPTPVPAWEWRVNSADFARVWVEVSEACAPTAVLAEQMGFGVSDPYSFVGFRLVEDDDVPVGHVRKCRSDMKGAFEEEPL